MKKLMIIGLMFLVTSGSLFAQRDGRGMGKPHDRQFDESFGDEMFEHGRHYEKLRIGKMLEFLELDEATKEIVLPIFIEERRSKRRLQNERINLVNRMAEQLKKSEVDEKELSQLIKKLNKNDLKQQASRDKFRNEIMQHLSTEQMAKIIVFEERFNRKLFGKMRQMGENPREHFENEKENKER